MPLTQVTLVLGTDLFRSDAEQALKKAERAMTRLGVPLRVHWLECRLDRRLPAREGRVHIRGCEVASISALDQLEEVLRAHAWQMLGLEDARRLARGATEGEVLEVWAALRRTLRAGDDILDAETLVGVVTLPKLLARILARTKESE